MLRTRTRLAYLGLVMVILAFGCDGPPIPASSGTESPSDVSRSGTSAPAAEQKTESINLSGVDETHRLDDLGVSVRTPNHWIRLNSGAAWSPNETKDLLVGVKTADLLPPQEPEALLLPSPSEIVDAVEVLVDGHWGRRFALEVFDPSPPPAGERATVVSYEIHVLVVVQRGGVRRALDLFVTAGSVANLEAIEEAFDAFVTSAALH